MKAKIQQGSEGYAGCCRECHMYEYLPTGQKSCVCARCMELMTLEQVRSLEVRATDLEVADMKELWSSKISDRRAT